MRKAILLLCLVLLVPMVSSGQSPSINYYPAGGGGTNDWNPLSPVLWDDFLLDAGTANLQIGQLRWALCTGSTAYIATTAGRPRVLRYTQAATAIGGVLLPAAAAWELQKLDTGVWWVAQDTDPTNKPHVRAGWLSTACNAAPSDDSVYFEHLGTDTNWFAVTRDGANETRTDTGLVFVASQFYKLQISHPASGQWDFYIDGSLKASRTTGYLPAESTVVYTMAQHSTTGTAVYFWFDYFWQSFKATR